MLRKSIFGLICALALVAAGCGTTVEDACNNIAEQCELEQEETDECIADGEALEEEDKINDEALDCLAEAASCDAVAECPEVESGEADEEATEE